MHPGWAEIQRIVDDAIARGAASAASVLVAIDGRVEVEHHTGTTRRWDAPGRPTAVPGPPVRATTRFDLASVTKPVVAAALLTELDARGLSASLPASRLLPEFDRPRTRKTTLSHLLSHTAGFAPEWFDRAADPGARRFRSGPLPKVSDGSAHLYSCVGYIWAGLAAEALADAPLDEVVRRRVLEPLGMNDTGYRPDASLRDRIAATEWQPDRGMVHGEVHDETSAALGGVSGNAGLFGTAHDLMRFAEALRTGGMLDGERVLAPAVAAALVTPIDLPDGPDYGQALGPRLGENWMRGLGERVAGHTGFTGTAFVTEPGGRYSVVFLANRVHPTRFPDEMRALRTRVVDRAVRWRDTE